MYGGDMDTIPLFKHSLTLQPIPINDTLYYKRVMTFDCKLKKDKVKSTNKECLDPFNKSLNDHWMTHVYKNNNHYEEWK
jgi:hypothetical protein